MRPSAGFTVHVAIAVTVGQLLTLLPHRVLAAVLAGLFLAGAAYLLAASRRSRHREGADAARQGGVPLSARWRWASGRRSAWAVTALAVNIGSKSLSRIPMTSVV